MALLDMAHVRGIAESERQRLNESADIIIKRANVVARARSIDVFLSHKYPSKSGPLSSVLRLPGMLTHDDVLGVRRLLRREGLNVFIDWLEPDSPGRDEVTPDTAEWLKEAIVESRCLLYLVSVGSASSRWMPWELGLADGMGRKVAIIPLSADPASDDSFIGEEYLGLYPFISRAMGTDNKQHLWVNDGTGNSILLAEWIAGA